ncbi:MAG TPA: EAL domain-containing protein, partial [Halothiobacillus sp.]|nr:EAL domain-containing protein [Halothiobacillus sp.]
FAHLGELVLLLRNQSLRDPLTGLPNRALFLDRLTVARAQAVRRNSILAVIILDLDGFKQVNDHLGHGAGDSLLLGVVKRIQTLLRAGDTLARMGGDEFGLLMPNLTQVNDIEGLSDRILAAIKEPFEIHGEQVSVSGSMGITLYPDPDEGDPDTLIRHADMALYAAKDLGKDQYYLHTFALDDALNHERNTRSLVEQALDEDRMLLYYQPIVSTQGQVVGMEALIRMQDPIKGILAPVAFASALDHPKLARRIGCFVLEAAIKQAEQWQETGLNLDVSINISPRHLLDSRFIQDLQETLARHSTLAANRIELEVTESAPLTDMNGAQSQLAACRVLGVNIALDDFGTGNASLTYLQQLNVQCIKIDQNFVRDIIHDPKDLAIVAALITASRMLGLKVIAEGVEDNDHAELLAGLGCNLLQGYFFTRPLPAAEVPTWIERFQSLAQKAQGECAIDILPPIMEGHRLRFL